MSINPIPIVPYALYGYPTREASTALLHHYAECGVEWIEIGWPFSDPIADGPLLQSAHQIAVKSDVTFTMLCEDLAALKGRFPSLRLALMTYLNPLLATNLPETLITLGAYFDATVVPDLPLEHFKDMFPQFEKNGMPLVPLIAVNMPKHRIDAYSAYTAPFIYLVSTLGTTGGSVGTEAQVLPVLKALRAKTTTPIFLGFGLRTTEDLKQWSPHFDGLIMATELLRRYQEGQEEPLNTPGC